jgi:hypothetical protein
MVWPFFITRKSIDLPWEIQARTHLIQDEPIVPDDDRVLSDEILDHLLEPVVAIYLTRPHKCGQKLSAV